VPRTATPLLAGEYYHLYNRGHNQQNIFFDRENCLFFLRRMRKYLIGEAKTLEAFVEIVAYCLMPNHYHILLCPHDDDLSRRMQRFSISYTKAINKRYERVGTLFQGQLKAVHVDRDEYLLHWSRYIHLNPVAAALVQRPEEWEFSSYREYVGLRQGTLPSPDIVLSQLPAQSTYREFVESYQPDDGDAIPRLLLDDD
jgi:putative transposase